MLIQLETNRYAENTHRHNKNFNQDLSNAKRLFKKYYSYIRG
jgi:hypothetical protein